MRTYLLAAAVILIGAVGLPAHAQDRVTIQETIQGPPIDPGSPLAGMFGARGRDVKTGTGRLQGRVMASDGSGPIRRAQVRLSGNDIAAKAALTDAQGRFTFRELPAGRFTMQVQKSGYVSIQYGQTRPFESGKPIELADKQALDDLVVNLPKGSVISGRVVDEFGDPVPDSNVMAMRQTWSNGRRRLAPAPARSAQTNDLGQFRLYGLPPGDYYVTATLRSGAEGSAMFDFDGMFGAAASATGAPGSAPRTGYATTYFPGTANPSEAQKIALTLGQESGNTDFALLPVRLARVTGSVINSEGKPVEGASVSVSPSTREGAVLMGPNSARTGKDGAFTLTSVPPGDYTLRVQAIQMFTTTTQGDNMAVFRSVNMGSPGNQESGSTSLDVAGEDLAGVVIVTSKGGTATGQVTFDGPSKPDARRINITSAPADNDTPMFGLNASLVKEDGTFELNGLTGQRFIRVSSPPPGWSVRSIKLNGTDITDSGAEFKAGEKTTGLEIEMTSRVTSVSGAVTKSDGSAVTDYTAVIFSENADHWRLPMTRRVAGIRPDQDGRFKIPSLPPGSYYAVAVDYIPQGEWADPELLDRLKSRATRFTLDEGATHTLDLKLVDKY